MQDLDLHAAPYGSIYVIVKHTHKVGDRAAKYELINLFILTEGDYEKYKEDDAILCMFDYDGANNIFSIKETVDF